MPNQTIQIHNIPYHDFQQFQLGTRFSIQFTHPYPPKHNQNIKLHCEHVPGLHPQPQPLDGHVKYCISLDTVLNSKDFYDITIQF